MNPDLHKVEYPLVTRDDRYLDGRPCVIAMYPDLPGCSAHGSNLDEAIASLRHAKAAYLDYLDAKGHNIPLPSKYRERVWHIGRLSMTGSTASSSHSWTIDNTGGTPPAGVPVYT